MAEQRRSTDPDMIERMIADESDPKNRAFLLILNNINKSLCLNTETIIEVSNKLDEHLTKFEEHTAAEERIINQGRGAWKVVSWVLGIVQVIGLAIWVDSRKEIAEIHAMQHEAQVERKILTQRVEQLEKIK